MTLTPKAQKSSRRSLRLVLILLVLAAAGAGIWHLTRPEPVVVLVRRVDRGRVEETVANTRAGSVRACRRAKLTPSYGGQVHALRVRDGSVVKHGDVVLELWNADLKAEVRLAESQAVASRAKAEEACLRRAQAKRDFDRLRGLHEDGIEPIEKAEQAETNYEVSAAECQAAKASTKQSEARIEVAQAALEKTILRSPFDGVVAEVNAELGEYVTPSPPGIPTPPAIDLIESGCIYIVAPIDEVDVPRVRLGLEVRVRLDSYSGRVFPGRVRRIAPYVQELEKQARTVDVEVDLQNPEDLTAMIPGYSADAEILIDVRENVLRVPTESIINGRLILVLVDGVLAERQITTGLANWEETEVLSGIEEGELVVLSLGREGVEAGVAAVAEQ